MAVRAVLATVGIVAAMAAITHPWKALSQSAQPVIPLINGTPGGTSGNPVNVTGSFSSTTTGFPTTQTTGTPISVTTGGVTGTLPSGAVVVATNVGTTNLAYCKLGASATTSDQAIAPNGGWFAFTVGASTQLTCITSTSTTTVNMVGGSGLPTGTGGGGGGSTSNSTGAIQNVAAATNILDALGVCQYLATPPTITDTRYQQCLMDVNGNVKVSVTNVNANGQATMANSSPVVIASNQSTLNVNVTNATTPGQVTPANSLPVVQAGLLYQVVAAGATATALVGAGSGATGDYLSHCVIQAASTTPGVVTVFDNTNTGANNVIDFPGGASSVSNLVPISYPVGAFSKNGPWKVTTGSNVSVRCFGNFS
jgi:hypothetical protein